ncbi:AfsR/SARP family transcriptional regulator [Micromonospora rhizosphaerae]|nr:BTAD domain-containing putative transcriptional regulator [Micromonospora rhizosphaerae]
MGATVVLGLLPGSDKVPDSLSAEVGVEDAVFLAALLSFAGVGVLVSLRLPGNPVGWLLLAEALLWPAVLATAGYAGYSIYAKPALPGGVAAAWVLEVAWVLPTAPATFLMLLIPDGHLPTPRWRPVAWASLVAGALIVVTEALTPGPMVSAPDVSNPFGVGSRPSFLAVEAGGQVLGSAAFFGSALAFAIRFRSARGVARQQMKWMAYAVAVLVAASIAASALSAAGAPGWLVGNLNLLPLVGLPLAVGVAVLRYRLWDIDAVIRRTVLVALLGSFATAVYLAFVVGVGAAVGRSTDSDVLLAVVATAVVAAALQAILTRSRRLAWRLVHGRPTGSTDDPAPPPAGADHAELRRPADGVRVRTLGGLRVLRDGEPLTNSAWQSKKARDLLKVLVARRGRSTPRDFLMDVLWPDEDPGRLGNRLAVAVSTVRAVLDPGKRHDPQHYLVSDRDSLRVDLTHLRVDVEEFLAEARRGLALLHAGDGASALPVLARAQSAYDGDFLEENVYDDWSNSLREEARDAYLCATRALAKIAEKAGDPASAAEHWRRVLECDPWNAEGDLGLARCLEGQGRHGEARRRYGTYVARMRELGLTVEPFPRP